MLAVIVIGIEPARNVESGAVSQTDIINPIALSRIAHLHGGRRYPFKEHPAVFGKGFANHNAGLAPNLIRGQRYDAH